MNETKNKTESVEITKMNNKNIKQLQILNGLKARIKKAIMGIGLLFGLGLISSCSGPSLIIDSIFSTPILLNQNFKVPYDIDENYVIGRVLSIDSDTDSNALTYRIANKDTNQGLFEIGASGGQLNLAPNRSLTANNNYPIWIEVSDGRNASTGMIEVNTGSGQPRITNHVFSVQEDISDTNVIGTVRGTDDGQLTYELLTEDNVLFEIGSDSGELSLSHGYSLDYDIKSSHQLVVGISDGEFSNMAMVRIDVGR